jgi:hypothetical protein
MYADTRKLPKALAVLQVMRDKQLEILPPVCAVPPSSCSLWVEFGGLCLTE